MSWSWRKPDTEIWSIVPAFQKFPYELNTTTRCCNCTQLKCLSGRQGRPMNYDLEANIKSVNVRTKSPVSKKIKKSMIN
jgi:hypothetical protein